MSFLSGMTMRRLSSYSQMLGFPSPSFDTDWFSLCAMFLTPVNPIERFGPSIALT